METEIPEVEVRKKRVKRFYLRIDRQGHISLTVPVRTSEETIRKILAEKAEWIRVHYAKVCARAPEEHTFAAGETVYLFGEPLTLRVSVGQGKARAERSGGELVLTLPAAKAEETAAREKLVRGFYADAMRERVAERLPLWESRVGRQAAAIQYRWMKSRWGSCSPTSAHIRLNLQLAWYPSACLDLVIVHELTHLWVSGHGKPFWERVERVYPAWREVKAARRAFPACPL